MNRHISRAQRVPEVFTADARPGADALVYCKGCGTHLPGEPRHQKAKVQVTVMMCEDCRTRHGHALMPLPGSPSFCYRCGGADELYIEEGYAPITHRVCPRCVPERAARYSAGNFQAPEPNRAL